MKLQSSPLVKTQYGTFQGVIEKGLFVFKGIPYSVSMSGKNRWLPPPPAKPFKGVCQAQEFSPVAMQMIMPSNPNVPFAEQEQQNENCLFLNIYSPGLDDKKRAVMVWIHGGGYHMGSGSSSLHPGHTLPNRGDIIFISINYRLGPLGFLHLNDITRGVIPSCGNEGLLDQIAALKWIKENIAVFGGDPNNITVFGESAGAMSIGCLLAMPESKGIFQKAILQSGASTVRTLNEGVANAEKYLNVLGTSEISKLHNLPGQNFIDAYAQLVGNAFWSMSKGTLLEPIIDGRVLPELPLDAFKHGSAKEIKVMAGSTLDEVYLFAQPDASIPTMNEKELIRRVEKFLPADFAAELISTYRSASPERRSGEIKPFQIFLAIFTDLQFRMPAVRLMESQVNFKQNAYNYIFDWQSPQTGLKACHSLELGFLFGNRFDEFHGVGPAAEKLGEQMQDAWIAFAKTGDPSCESLGNWPAYGQQRYTMLLGANSHVEAAPFETERRVWQRAPDNWLG
ncbi:MAG: carboxylesterase/lipase family protein [Dehalococcoidales bacterium]|nr:carboxylesterase/lipase family protein [Dehalococcoidales bacterium]